MSKSLALRGAATAFLMIVGLLILPGSAEQSPTTARALGANTAAARYGWRPALFDFEWEYGESLTDPPGRGSKLVGTWVDLSTGSGAAAQHNGGVMLMSKYGRVVPKDAGPGDFGTTSITLSGNAQIYGRWEARMRPWVIENTGTDYRVKMELVPADPAKWLCGARAITVADVTPRRNEVRIGAFTPSKKRRWSTTRKTGTISGVPHAYAVEVAKDHISWFMDGNIIGTLKAKAAIPRVPLTLKFSLVGSGSTEMNHTYVVMDWMRGFTIKSGKHPTNGGKLTAGKHNLHC